MCHYIDLYLIICKSVFPLLNATKSDIFSNITETYVDSRSSIALAIESVFYVFFCLLSNIKHILNSYKLFELKIC